MARQKKELPQNMNEIWPRIMRHVKKKVVTNNPCSFASFHIQETTDTVVKVMLFAGTIKKIGFNIGEVIQESKDAIVLRCSITDGEDIKGFDITTKKTNHYIDVNKKVKDGDVFTVTNVREDVILKDVSFSFLIIPETSTKTTEEIPLKI